MSHFARDLPHVGLSKRVGLKGSFIMQLDFIKRVEKG